MEKVFDEMKSKLGEKKAWGTSLTVKATQEQLVGLTHNLPLIYEARLEREHGVNNAAEDKRRQERQRELKQAARQAGSPLMTLRTGLRRATQRSVNYIRWLLSGAARKPRGRSRSAPLGPALCHFVAIRYGRHSPNHPSASRGVVGWRAVEREFNGMVSSW